MKDGTDKLLEAVFSPETAFLGALAKMKQENYEATIYLERIKSMHRFEKMQARQFLEVVEEWIHKMQGRVAGRQLIRKT